MDSIVGKLAGSLASSLLGPLVQFSWTKSYTPVLWRRCFKKAAVSAGFDPVIAARLSDAPGLQRLMINTFKADRDVPSAIDFAIAIAFELFHKDGDKDGGHSSSSDRIRHLAVDVRQLWINGIINSAALQKNFGSIRDAHPAKYISVGASCLPEDNEVLADWNSLFVQYFSNYSTADSTEIVRVWMPNDDGFVHFSHEQRNIVDVALNTSVGADRGFFRVGFDYSILRTGDKLHVCFLDYKTGMEAGHFGSYSVGRASPAVMWAR